MKTLPLPPFVQRSVLEQVPTPNERERMAAEAAFLETIAIPAEVAAVLRGSSTAPAQSDGLVDRLRQLRRLTRDGDVGWRARLTAMRVRAEKIAIQDLDADAMA